MTDFDRNLCVSEAICTAARMMLCDKNLNDDYYSICIEQTLKYDLEIIGQALKNWVRYNRGQGHMPAAWQLAAECKNLAQKNTSKFDKFEKCTYFSDRESHYSKSMCNPMVSESDANIAKLCVDKVVCFWHMDCLLAKADPDGFRAVFVRAVLKSLRDAEKNGDILQNIDDFAKICFKNAI